MDLKDAQYYKLRKVFNIIKSIFKCIAIHYETIDRCLKIILREKEEWCLSACMSAYLYVHLTFRQSFCLTVHLSVRPPVNLHICLFICHSVCMSVCPCRQRSCYLLDRFTTKAKSKSATLPYLILRLSLFSCWIKMTICKLVCPSSFLLPNSPFLYQVLILITYERYSLI